MEPTKKSGKILPTLSLILPLLPWVLSAILLAASLGGNWAFLVLALIVFVTSNCLCGASGMILAILTLHRRVGIKRGIAATILCGIDLFLGSLLLIKILI